MSKQPKPQVVSLDSAREDASYWLKDCIFENGKPLPILANAVVGIRAIMPMAFAFDEVLRAPLLMEPLKGDRDKGDLLAPRAQPQKPTFPVNAACAVRYDGRSSRALSLLGVRKTLPPLQNRAEHLGLGSMRYHNKIRVFSRLTTHAVIGDDE